MKETEQNTNTPPAVTEETDGSRDAELLRAISEHPELAEALAAIAGGTPASEALAAIAGGTPAAEALAPLMAPESPPGPEVAMYQSPALASRKGEDCPESFPAFLSAPREDFWESGW